MGGTAGTAFNFPYWDCGVGTKTRKRSEIVLLRAVLYNTDQGGRALFVETYK